MSPTRYFKLARRDLSVRSSSMMEKLPFHSGELPARPRRSNPVFKFLALFVITGFSFAIYRISGEQYGAHRTVKLPINSADIVQKCRNLNVKPGPPTDFHLRSESDRFVNGTPPTLLRNATIWTGSVSGYEVVRGDILLDKGIIQAVGGIKPSVLRAYGAELVVHDVAGAWVSPGYVFNSVVLSCRF